MSMISAQIDELRRMADGQVTYRDARAVMLRAADTITELRGALLVASVDYRHLSEEVVKLRELVREIWRSCPVSEDDCAKCPHRIEESDEVWCDIPILMEALGVEVD